MRYPDTVQIATITADGYGDKTVTLLSNCKAAFIRRKGSLHELNADGIVSDATVYLDPQNATVKAKVHADELEGLYISYLDNWYIVNAARVAERKLLNNKIDNVYCLLDRVQGVAYATNVS